MVITGARNTYADFGAHLLKDFTGPNNFLYWLLAIGSVGALGYVDALRGFSRAFMVLIILAMVLKNGGVFNQIQQAIQQGPKSPTAAVDSITGGNASSTSSDIAAAANFAIHILPFL
jgi:hypothetical protein